MIRRLWKYFLTGLLVLMPALITLAIVQLIVGWLYGIFIRPVTRLVGLGLPPGADSQFLVRLFIIAGFIVAVLALGFATRVLLVRRLMDIGETLVRRVPIVGTIYWTTREISQTFTGAKRGLFTRVVLLEWPRPGMYSIGFVTSEGQGEVQQKTPEHVVNVFIPTTPNPTSGFLVLAPRESLINLTMSVEEAMRLVISGGVVGPNVQIPQK